MPDDKDRFDRAFDAYRDKFDEGPPLMLSQQISRDTWADLMERAIADGEPLTEPRVADYLGDDPLPDGARW